MVKLRCDIMGPNFFSGASSIILSSICSIFRHRFPGNFRKTSWKFRKFTFSGWFFPPEIYFLRLFFSPEIYFLRQVFISRKFPCLIGCGLASTLLITEISWEFFCSVGLEPSQRYTTNPSASHICTDVVIRAGHNFRCPLLSALSVVPLVNGTTVMFQF